MSLTKSEIKEKLSVGVTRPFRRDVGDQLIGVRKIDLNTLSSIGKSFDPSQKDKATDYYQRYFDEDSITKYDPDTDIIVLYTATIDHIDPVPQNATADTELLMELTDITIEELHRPEPN